ncbi:uncharacterized protein BX664DRAFT_382808 [Halteromyces radiatus]|uniref:uncharacterized protein n=1 Tax=Halteromyces radiatus TaxID=101107 RepID=UPI00221F4623|nr:uncharacterized protein BX664DRAFT_382808 [Halteromyces radiatus]KAI8096350.1 hypothetical protein BX664DRAFT_382808 [Halteromyces radiatus]
MADIVLPWRHRPGTDMISKLVLQENSIINVVVEYLVGTRAKDKYRTNPTEWINGTRSDVLLTCDDDPSLPPVLIEVQHVKQYGVLPIVLIFPITSIRFDVLNRTRKRKSHPLLIHYPCLPWAQSCFLVDQKATNLQQPLVPFASLCIFLMRQDSSLLSSPYHADRTMQLLYCLAQRHVGTTILDHDHDIADFLHFCNEMKTRLAQLLHLFQDNDHDDKVSVLNDTIMLVDSYQEKYKQKLSTVADTDPEPSTLVDTNPEPSNIADTGPEPSTLVDTNPEPSTLAVTNPEPSTLAATNPEPSTVADHHLRLQNTNWGFVENCIANLNQGESISWNVVYQQGKTQGLFTTYSNAASMKRAYYRFKAVKK